MASQTKSTPSQQISQKRTDSWEDLARHSSESNAFYAPDMLSAALNTIAENDSIHIIEARKGATLIGLLPVTLSGRHGRLPIACVTNWMHDHCFYGAALVRSGVEEDAWRMLLNNIEMAPWSKGFLYLRSIDPDSPSAQSLQAVCASDQRGIKEVNRYQRALLQSDLSANDYWEINVNPKRRKDIRRLQKRLSELGHVAARQLESQDQLGQWCDDFLTLEASGWKGRQGTALKCKTNDIAFFREACRSAFNAGRLHFLRIDFDDRPIAMLVNFRHGEGAFSFKIAFDENLARFSPGVINELFNLHSVLGDPSFAWMDSCASPDHPMINSLWSERRNIVQYRISLKGRGLQNGLRKAAFSVANGVEAAAAMMKGKS